MVADKEVTGTGIDPSGCIGKYRYLEQYGGGPVWRHTGSNFYIYWPAVVSFPVITDEYPTDPPLQYFINDSGSVIGQYTALPGSYVGSPVVADYTFPDESAMTNMNTSTKYWG